jgi:hypothetical protein
LLGLIEAILGSFLQLHGQLMEFGQEGIHLFKLG